MEVILNINNLFYNDIFKNLSIYIEKNTITAISGSNNCGKTTLTRILNREVIVDSNIIYNSKNIYDYKEEEYKKLMQIVYPNQLIISNNIVLDELLIQKEAAKEKVDFVITKLNINKMIDKEISQLSEKEIVLFQIAKSIINSKEIVIIDEIDNYFSKEELAKLYKAFRECIIKYDLTFIITCLNLSSTIYLDYLYIINDGKVILKGEPIKVLEKDNILNKVGLELPFMIDLSVKLKDYDLIKEIIFSQKEMIDKLWK